MAIGVPPRLTQAEAGELGADLDDHVFLPADGLAPSHLEQDLLLRHAKSLRRLLGVEQERAVHTAVAEQQR
jgi:hypothetical protein